MSAAIQELADAANDAYKNRSPSEVGNKIVEIDRRQYQVFGYVSDQITGFHATAYQQVGAPNRIIIAYRGTDPGLFSGANNAEKTDRALTTLQDIAVDATMVRDAVNPQKTAADRFTQAMIDKATAQGLSKDHISVAGHSLGGTLAEIEAARYGLHGSTFNAYGAQGLNDGPPQPGCQLTNYVMAGDVVSAANRHVGRVVPLASPEDIQSLRAGRYLDAPAGAPPPNPLIAMRLSDHGGQQHFGGPNSVLAPARLADYAQRYADHRVAVDAYRNDVAHERGELSEALRQIKQHHGTERLPPDIQRQVNEYLAANVDRPVHRAIEQNRPVQGVEQGLQYGADFAHASGEYVQKQDERAAAAMREAAAVTAAVDPMASLAGRALGEAAQLQGQVANAEGHFVGEQLHSARRAVEQRTHQLAQAVVGEMHDPAAQAAAAGVTNRIVDTYHDAQSAARSIERTVDSARQSVSRGLHAGEHLAGQTYDALTHPGQWSPHDAAPQAAHAGTTQRAAASSPHTVGTPSPQASSDPRQPGHPQHGLYETLERRIPEASQNRLLQFTAACHDKGITEKNIGRINFIEDHGLMHIQNRSWGPSAIIDIKTPPPSAQESIHHMQQTSAAQAQVQATIQQMNPAQPGMQGPGMGGAPMR